MKNSEKQDQKIFNYLYGDMKSHEKVKFEDELEHQTELKKELLLQQEIDAALTKEIKVAKFKDAITKIHEKQNKKNKGKLINLHNKWYWAAASITIFSGTAIYSLKSNTNTPDHLFNSYYQLYHPSVITRGAESEIYAATIISDFERGEYAKVITALQGDYSINSLDPKLLLLKGCSEMELHDYNAAIVTFSIFDSKDYTFYTEAAQWYQSLCHLKIGETNESKLILRTIVESNTSYASEAKELLSKLK